MPAPLPSPRRHGAARGFALIEALIAILIFSLGVLGLVGLQVSLTRASAGAKYRSEAAFLASDLIGTMWTDAINLGAYKNCASHAACNTWLAKVDRLLPSASTTIAVCTAADSGIQCQDALGNASVGRVTVTITWTVPQEGTHTYTTTSTINPNT